MGYSVAAAETNKVKYSPLKQPSKTYLLIDLLSNLPMKTDDLKQLIKDGLSAQQAGSHVAAKATDEILDDAKHPDLKAALQEGNETAKKWAQRIEQALAEAGGAENQNNEILEAHYQVSKEIRAKATSDTTRDLGIIASGQMALHYWIASFGTVASYAASAGLTETEQNLKACVQEAKQADDKHTDIAQRILAEQGLE
jgi:ferritin-like metal-binding protein YciE